MSTWINLSALAKILGVGLLAGAGLPALFAVGLHSLRPAPAGAGGATRPAGAAVAAACFAVVLAAIGYGIYLIVAG